MRPASWTGSRPKTPRSPSRARRRTKTRRGRAKRRRSAERRLAGAESALAEAQAAASDLAARRRALTDAVEEEGRRLARLEAEYAAIERERGALSAAGFEESRARGARSGRRRTRPRRWPAPSARRWRRRQRHAEAREIEARRRGASGRGRTRGAEAGDGGAHARRAPRLGFERPLAARGRRGQRRARL